MIRLSETIVDEIELQAIQAYPEECCGMLLGYTEGVVHFVEEVLKIENSQESNRQRRFYITPEQYRFAEQLARKWKMELLGFYHSHPDHPAAPSAFDTEHAFPWFSYVIVSVAHGKPGAMTAWLLDEESRRFHERIIIVEPTPIASAPRQSVLSHNTES